MHKDDIDWKSGKVALWTDYMETLDLNLPLAEQMWEYDEDLGFVNYPHDYLLDLSWYPRAGEEGKFRVCVVKDEDWDEPLFDEGCNSTGGIVPLLNKAILFVEHCICEGDSE